MVLFRPNCPRRWAPLLLAVYALFVVAPGVHLLVHGHAPAGVAAVDGAAPAVIVPGCGDGCSHPFHTHEGHAAHGACALCQALGGWTGLLPVARGWTSVLAPVGLSVVGSPDSAGIAALSTPGARAPPASFAA